MSSGISPFHFDIAIVVVIALFMLKVIFYVSLESVYKCFIDKWFIYVHKGCYSLIFLFYWVLVVFVIRVIMASLKNWKLVLQFSFGRII